MLHFTKLAGRLRRRGRSFEGLVLVLDEAASVHWRRSPPRAWHGEEERKSFNPLGPSTARR